MDKQADGDQQRPRDDFTDGLRCFQADDYVGALAFFRAADESADHGDVFHNRYTSYHGLSRVCMGDSSGIKLCRKSAVGEARDADVYYNLAMAEHQLGNRESAWTALRRGLRLDPGHARLRHLRKDINLRKQHSLVPGLRRDGVVNRLLGRLLRGARRPYSKE